MKWHFRTPSAFGNEFRCQTKPAARLTTADLRRRLAKTKPPTYADGSPQFYYDAQCRMSSQCPAVHLRGGIAIRGNCNRIKRSLFGLFCSLFRYLCDVRSRSTRCGDSSS
ncbi:MAG: hypothetical protein ACRCUY_10245 [Thermoguttaceae bacterium]